MLAMVVNDDADSLISRGALAFFASVLAPTGGHRFPGSGARTKMWAKKSQR
jgi:hypothetical protein